MKWAWLLAPALLVLAAALPAREARASVDVAIGFDDLVRASQAAVVATCVDQRSMWEGGRIYTYSKVHVDTAMAGELGAGGEAWVRTMGGVVGDVGQIVDGEAVLTPGRPSLLFLRRSTLPSQAGSSAYVVAARAQGQFGLYTDTALDPDVQGPVLRLRRNSALGALVPRAGQDPKVPLAKDVLHGRKVTDAAKDIGAAWGRTHAP